MPTHHYPTLPVGVMQFHHRWQIVNPAGGFYGVQRAVFSFINQNPFPPGWNPVTDPAFLQLAWLQGISLDIVPLGTSFPQAWFFANTPVGFIVQQNPNSMPSGIRGHCMDPALCVCYSKFASPPSRNLTGRTHLYPIPHDLISGGSFDAVGLSTYQARMANLMATITWDGVIFSPAIFSNTLNTYTTLDRTVLVERPSYIYRRRASRDRKAARWIWVP